MRFDYFVIPFCLGFGYLIIVLLVKYGRWVSELGDGSVTRILKSLPSKRTGDAIAEVFMECLIHRKVFRVNRLLGVYAHESGIWMVSADCNREI